MTVDDRLCRAGAEPSRGAAASRAPAVAMPVQDGRASAMTATPVEVNVAGVGLAVTGEPGRRRRLQSEAGPVQQPRADVG